MKSMSHYHHVFAGPPAFPHDIQEPSKHGRIYEDRVD